MDMEALNEQIKKNLSPLKLASVAVGILAMVINAADKKHEAEAQKKKTEAFIEETIDKRLAERREFPQPQKS